MVRSYSTRAVPGDVLDSVLDIAVRGPSAGFCQGVDLLVLEGREQVGLFFEKTSDPEFISGPRALPGLLNAPVIVLPICDPDMYVSRYAEPDKAHSSLAGLSAERWPTPYWLVDASFMVMLLLLAATDNDLGALFFRLHKDPGPLLRALGVPENKQVIGAISLGYDATAGSQEAPSGSPARRGRRPTAELVHRGTW